MQSASIPERRPSGNSFLSGRPDYCAVSLRSRSARRAVHRILLRLGQGQKRRRINALLVAECLIHARPRVWILLASKRGKYLGAYITSRFRGT